MVPSAAACQKWAAASAEQGTPVPHSLRWPLFQSQGPYKIQVKSSTSGNIGMDIA